MKWKLLVLLTPLMLVQCKAMRTTSQPRLLAINKNEATALQAVIRRGACNVLDLKNSAKNEKQQVLYSGGGIQNGAEKQSFWSMRPYLGTFYLGQYYLLQKWMGRPTAPMDVNRYAKILLTTQLKNGSWLAVHDAMTANLVRLAGENYIEYGDLNPTLFAFWSLRAMVLQGELNSEITALLHQKKVLERAQNFIMMRTKNKGESFATLTTLFLSLFGQYDWNSVIDRGFIQKIFGLDGIPLWFANGNFNFLGLGPKSFAQWVPAVILPLAYAINSRMQKDLGSAFDIATVLEIPMQPTKSKRPMTAHVMGKQTSIDKLMKLILKSQGPKGSFGGYTLHSHFTAVALQDYAARVLRCHEKKLQSELCSKAKSAIEKAIWFTRALYLDSDYLVQRDGVKPLNLGTDTDKAFTSSYKGVTCDGTFWDTVLLGQALAKAGVAPHVLQPMVDFSIAQQQRSSAYKGFRGFPFGWDFWQYPDNDDTAEFILFLHDSQKKQRQASTALDYLDTSHAGKYSAKGTSTAASKKIDRTQSRTNALREAVGFLIEMQNSDGGWGAFDHENNGNFILNYFAKSLLDSADLFDESSVDVTGHVLEALADLGFRSKTWTINSTVVRWGKTAKGTKTKRNFIARAIAFIEKRQKSYFVRNNGSMVKDEDGDLVQAKGPWFGRWGVNYIYGTHAALNGLGKFYPRPMDSQVVRNAVTWLEQIQNSDGGFGETQLSYSRKAPNAFMGAGISTASQTAWALSALVAVGRQQSNSARMAAAYLITNMQKNGRWIDGSSVGTGHPKIVSMHYPSYAYAFPLIALSQYRDKRYPNLKKATIQCAKAH